jgi:hypothetical protein
VLEQFVSAISLDSVSVKAQPKKRSGFQLGGSRCPRLKKAIRKIRNRKRTRASLRPMCRPTGRRKTRASRPAAPSLKRGRRLQITDRTGAVEELLLELSGNRIPTQDHGSAQAPQDLLFDLSERGALVAMLSALNCPIEMNCNPILVFGQRRVVSALDFEIHSFRWANVAYWRAMR